MSALKFTKEFIVAGAAALCLTAAAPAAYAHEGFDLDNINLKLGEDFLQSLIDMDAEDIAEFREEMADARAEIADAIGDIEDAKAEANADPQHRDLILAALATAADTVESTTKGVFEKVRDELDKAEADLKAGKVQVSADEMKETTEAIKTIRTELAGIEASLGDLLAAMRA